VPQGNSLAAYSTASTVRRGVAGKGLLLRAAPRRPPTLPVEDFESGSVFGLILGDPDLVTPSRDRVVPVCNPDLSLPTSPHTA
jgi:hypothetical protein